MKKSANSIETQNWKDHQYVLLPIFTKGHFLTAIMNPAQCTFSIINSIRSPCQAEIQTLRKGLSDEWREIEVQLAPHSVQRTNHDCGAYACMIGAFTLLNIPLELLLHFDINAYRWHICYALLSHGREPDNTQGLLTPAPKVRRRKPHISPTPSPPSDPVTIGERTLRGMRASDGVYKGMEVITSYPRRPDAQNPAPTDPATNTAYVARSEISSAGNGLFANKFIPKGAAIGRYFGGKRQPPAHRILHPSYESDYVLFSGDSQNPTSIV